MLVLGDRLRASAPGSARSSPTRSPTPWWSRATRSPRAGWFRWITRNTDDRPRLTSFVIFLIALSPLPDGTIVMPLAMVHYGIRRLIVPLFLGKFFHNVLLALLFSLFASWAEDNVSKEASTSVALAVAVVFMLLVGLPRREGQRRATRRAEAAGRRAGRPGDRGSERS